MANAESSANSARHGTKLRSLLPKALLYDNVSLAQKLDREVTCISLEERKSAFTFAQMQRRFITDQAMKEEVHGMTLFPQIHPNQSMRSNGKSLLTLQKAQTMIDFQVPLLLSPTAQVARANTVLCEERRRSEPMLSPLPPVCSRAGKRKSRRTSNPLRDTRYVKLHGLLSDLPRNVEHRLYIAN